MNEHRINQEIRYVYPNMVMYCFPDLVLLERLKPKNDITQYKECTEKKLGRKGRHSKLLRRDKII